MDACEKSFLAFKLIASGMCKVETDAKILTRVNR